MNAYTLALDTVSGELETSEIGMFITRNAIVTVRKDEGVDIEAIVARWDESPRSSPSTASRSSCGACSTSSSTGTSKPCSRSTTEIEALEDLLFDEQPREAEVQRRSFELRKSLVLLRRLVTPMREVVNSLMRRDLHGSIRRWFPTTKTSTTTCCARTDWTESLRDLVTTILLRRTSRSRATG